ncbi:Os09g0249750, partial [Oryza sativa Japonica Group]
MAFLPLTHGNTRAVPKSLCYLSSFVIIMPDLNLHLENRFGSITLITTAVTDFSEQKKVLERRAYCSENLRIISSDLSDASAPAA